MSVIVGELFPTKRSKKWPYQFAAHLMADTLDELHVLAKSIGLKRAWFQDAIIPHYDLTSNMRMRALRAGAVPVDRRGEFDMIRKWRKRQ